MGRGHYLTEEEKQQTPKVTRELLTPVHGLPRSDPREKRASHIAKRREDMVYCAMVKKHLWRGFP